MFLARRSVAPARQLLRNQQPRRFDSHAAHHPAPANEGVGRSFYVTIGTFAASYVLYRIHKSTEESGSQSWISSLIEQLSPEQKVFEERNAIRTVAMEKAASDRHLFYSQGPPEHVDLWQPEVTFNSGSPYNVPAGSKVDMTAVAAHYERRHQKMDEARVARMEKENGSVYD